MAGACERCGQPTKWKTTRFCTHKCYTEARKARWADHYSACVKCGETSSHHHGHGVCNRCYQQTDHRVSKKREWVAHNEAHVREKNKGKYDRHCFDGNRLVVLERDGYRCRLCSSAKEPFVHHVDETSRPNRFSANNNPENLITLCRRCHQRVHLAKAPTERDALQRIVDAGLVNQPPERGVSNVSA